MTHPDTITHTRGFDLDRVTALYTELLYALGEDPDREGLKGTPGRVAAWWREFLGHDAGRTDTVFTQHLAHGSAHLVVVRGITAWSLCEHHLLPMRLDMTIGVRPDGGKVLGLSKFSRIVAAHAHRLQLQERIVDGVAADIVTTLGTPDVGVVAEGRHLCMQMRGVREQQASVLGYSFAGAFEREGALGDRLLTLAGAHT
ncbi:GTP cyclohydrolase I (plasmid) [Embleya sp. NBC_00888]|uniref:GTP cyclohydrolase I n=1 Tax=Embleya sp. NBC_00888 TaxID=2975960 RepID=UPI002F913E88|nr:GTP cyclohydrolase I [Embleya sp. NBC_00888]